MSLDKVYDKVDSSIKDFMISLPHQNFDLLVLQILLLSWIEPDLGPIPVLGLDLIRTPGLVNTLWILSIIPAQGSTLLTQILVHQISFMESPLKTTPTPEQVLLSKTQ